MIVITSTNPIHSVVFLILVFCNAAGLLVLLRTEFIAMMFLIIYVGAIAVLFLFVVMMLNIKVAEGGNEPAPGDVPEGMFQKRSWPLGGIVGAILFLEMAPFLFQIVP